MSVEDIRPADIPAPAKIALPVMKGRDNSSTPPQAAPKPEPAEASQPAAKILANQASNGQPASNGQSAANGQSAEASLAHLEQAAINLQELASKFNRKLHFSVDKRINRILVKILDKNTDKVVRELPPDEIVDMVARLKEFIGTMFDRMV